MSVFPLKGKKVWVAGHNGMVGSALVGRLQHEECKILTVERPELDLLNQKHVGDWLWANRPDAIFLAAAKVGGIHANATYPAEFLYNNLQIETNVIHAAYQHSVTKLLFLGSSCIYPRGATQPITEEALLTGALEPTNEWYAIAKIAGIKMCEAYRRQYGSNFIVVMPTNLYGPNDNYHPENAHVPAALIARFHAAKMAGDKQVMIWGTGTPLREFMHVDDLADACVFLMENYNGAGFLNVGSGQEISILDFARVVARVVGYKGDIVCDTSRPDGTPRKLLDCARLHALGWKAGIALEDGLKDAYADYLRGISTDAL